MDDKLFLFLGRGSELEEKHWISMLETLVPVSIWG